MARSFKYVGPYEEVEVNGLGLVKQGETVQADGEIADGLEGQETWEPVAAAKKKTNRDDSQEG